MIIFICSGSESNQKKPWNKLCAMLLTANLIMHPTFQLSDSQSSGKINTAVGLQWRMCLQETALCTSVLWQDHTHTITLKAWTKSGFVGTYPLYSPVPEGEVKYHKYTATQEENRDQRSSHLQLLSLQMCCCLLVFQLVNLCVLPLLLVGWKALVN